MNDNRCVLLFVKLPEKGKVKSRLARDMEWDLVRRLYESIVLDTIVMLQGTKVPFLICFDPPDALDRVRRWLGSEYSYLPQAGAELGERMEQAFVRVFREGADKALLIGSDIPGLSSAVILEAFESLTSHDAVIGPARDGGYYLIGFQKNGFDAAIFHDMIWSTQAVYDETIMRLRENAREIHVLPQCTDVDTKEDLKTLLHELASQGPADSQTLKFLRSQRSSILD
jgi:rSAM/selenodomain-associated transferase 1